MWKKMSVIIEKNKYYELGCDGCGDDVDLTFFKLFVDEYTVTKNFYLCKQCKIELVTALMKDVSNDFKNAHNLRDF